MTARTETAVAAVIDPDPMHFLSRVKPFLAGHAVDNSMLIALLHYWITGESPVTKRVGAYAHDADGAVIGVAVNVQGWRAALSSMPPEAVAPLEGALAEVDPRVPVVAGPIWPAAVFAERRGVRLGRALRPGKRRRGHVVDGDRPAPDVRGSARPAGESDLPLLTRWMREMSSGDDGFDAPARARSLIEHGQGFLWEVDAEPVALCGYSDPLLGIANCGPVYTVPERRGAGYGDAAWWAVREAARAHGVEALVHWVDLDYPPSNRLLARVGARPVGEEVREYTHVASLDRDVRASAWIAGFR